MDGTSEPPEWELPGGSQAGGDAGWTSGQTGTPSWGEPPAGTWSSSQAAGGRGGAPPLQPMAMGDLLDGAFKLLRANLGTVLLIAAVFLVPLELLGVFLSRLVVSNSMQNLQDLFNNAPATGPPPDQVFRDLGALFGGLGVAILPLLLAAVLTGAAVSRAVAASYLGQQSSVGDALRATARRSPALLVAFVLIHLCEWIALLACGFPALVPMTFFLCTTPAIMLEDLGPFKGMGRSASLVKSRFWPVLGIGVLSGLVGIVLSWILRFPFDFLASLAGPSWNFIPTALGGIVTELVVMPFVSIVATLVYFDARVRLEGLDLQMISQSQRGQGRAGGQAGGAALA